MKSVNIKHPNKKDLSHMRFLVMLYNEFGHAKQIDTFEGANLEAILKAKNLHRKLHDEAMKHPTEVRSLTIKDEEGNDWWVKLMKLV